jgi:enterochelin esterase family protein
MPEPFDTFRGEDLALLEPFDEFAGEDSSAGRDALDLEPLPPRPAKSHYVETVAREFQSETLASIWRQPNRSAAILDLYESRRQKGPLIEKVVGDAESLWVTFLYLGDQDTRAVWISGGPLLTDLRLIRFDRTDVWYLTRQAPIDGAFSYNFFEECFEMRNGEEIVVEVIDLLDELNPNFTSQGTSMLTLPKARKETDSISDCQNRGSFSERFLDVAKLNCRKRYDLYLPSAEPQGIAVFLDGEWFAHGWPEQDMGPYIMAPPILDRLIESGKIPPIAAAFVHSGTTRDHDLLFNPDFAEFLAEDLLPDVEERVGKRFDARQVLLAGASYGGLCASYVALQRSDCFGNVLSLSGSYWVEGNTPADSSLTYSEGGIQRGFLLNERLPIRFFIDTGTYELAEITLTNRHFRDILVAKGYDVAYREFPGNHDFLHWGVALVDGLVSLTQDWL